MRHTSIASWGNQNTFIHRIDPRVKLILLLAFLISLALLRQPSLVRLGSCLIVLACIAVLARLPIIRILRLSLIGVLFVGLFSLMVYLAGDSRRAWYILAKSYLSALAVLITISTAPLPKLLCAARFFHIPSFLLEVTQLIYRYLFVLRSEAARMQLAFSARAGKPGLRALQASSGMIAVLFGRSHQRAAMINQTMWARGFSGSIAPCDFAALTSSDVFTLATGLALAIALQFA